jgi:CIC family chloride channel protein
VGYTPIFGGHYNIAFDDPYQLIFYIVLGLLCGGIGILYPIAFYGIRDLFKKIKIPNYFKPAIGGLAVGVMGYFLPQVLGMGYGWLQISMQPQTIIPLGIMVLLIFAKILATSLSIGSGGSGGVFAPGLFIGGMVGAAFWSGLHNVIPHMPTTPEPFIVVGMMALFGGVARAPLAVMFMVGEMAGSYTMLAPAMIAVGIAYVIVGRHTIYESQVASPAESPAHRYEYSSPLLANITVKEAMKTNIAPLSPQDTAAQVETRLAAVHLKALPVIDPITGNLAGIVSQEDLFRVIPGDGTRAADFMTTKVITISPKDSLDSAMQMLADHDISSLPVVDKVLTGPALVGIINRNDVAKAYARAAKGLFNKKTTG